MQKYLKIPLLAVLLVGFVFISGCIGKEEANKKGYCEWSAISSKYTSGSCSGSITKGEATVNLKGMPVENAKLIFARALPCQRKEGYLECIGPASDCSIISETAPFKAKCPTFGTLMAVEMRFGLPRETETECYNSYPGQPADICWFGTAKAYSY